MADERHVEVDFLLRSIGFVASAGAHDSSAAATFDASQIYEVGDRKFDLRITITEDGVERLIFVAHESGWAGLCPQCGGMLRDVSSVKISCSDCGHVFAS